MLKNVAVVFVLLFICSCGGSTCTDPTVRALKEIDKLVSRDRHIVKGKYVALVAEARTKLEEMQRCLPTEELNGPVNEHLRNALIHYDEALSVWDTGNRPQLQQYWEQAREELNKIE